MSAQKLGSVRIAGEMFELWLDPKVSHGEFDSTIRRITIREKNLKHAIHELFHVLLWCHGLEDLIKPDADEALACAMEISWLDAYARLRALIEPEPED